MCAVKEEEAGECQSSSTSSEEQRNQQLKMVLTIAQGEGAEFQHATFYYNGFKES